MALPKKVNGKWLVDIRVGGRRWQRTFETKAEAKAFHDEKLASRFTGRSMDPDTSPPFSETAETFLNSQRARVRTKDLTQGALTEMETHVRRLCALPVNDRTLGDVRVGRITVAMIRHQIIPAIREGRAVKTARNYYSTFKAVMKYAREDEQIAANPAFEVTLGVKVERTDRAKQIAKPVIRAILEACDPDKQLLFRFALQTGLRAGEQAVLRWTDIDLEKREVRVQRARKKDGSIGPAKTKAGKRTISIGRTLARDLKAWRLAQPVEQRRFGLVFPTDAGTHEVSTDNWRNRILAPACKRAGVDLIRWHDLRHVFASTMMFDLQWSDAVMTQMMGHASIDLFRSTYAHWREDDSGERDYGSEMEAAME